MVTTERTRHKQSEKNWVKIFLFVFFNYWISPSVFLSAANWFSYAMEPLDEHETDFFSAQICAAQKAAKRSNFSIFIAHAWSHEPVIATYLNKFITNTLLRGLKIARQTFFGDSDFAVKFANRLHLRFLIAQFAIKAKSMCRWCRCTELWQFIKAHNRITNFSESFRIFVDESTRIRSRKDQQTPTAPRAKVQ